ncbi:MAG: Gfo/Idh/MocA family oxidoreductase [Shinella sp.]|nr:Gfo/Idh/MocA family oxidoreductase [Shinella sp.]
MNKPDPEHDNATANARRPRLGFLGTGWIGRHRMKAIVESGIADAVAIADPSPEMAGEARKIAPSAIVVPSLEELLALDLDGIVIATPSALHAGQSLQALERGRAVFCQKPLGRDAAEAKAVIDAARRADRLLDVDLSYRHTEGMRRIRALIEANELGDVFAVDLVFHNAYGPDKAWFYDRSLSGGGCVMDLGVHLIDLALWALDFPEVMRASGSLYSQGRPLDADSDEVEDFSIAAIELENGTILRLTCSWRLQAGCDAIISASFYGTAGGATFRNIDGSFFDFVAEQYHGTQKELLTMPPDEWGGRAAVDWAKRLAEGQRFDPKCEHLVELARAIDAIYGR